MINELVDAVRHSGTISRIVILRRISHLLPLSQRWDNRL
jgi:hypothetical protein